MTKLRGAREALPPVFVGAGPSSTWARCLVKKAWLMAGSLRRASPRRLRSETVGRFLRQVWSARDAAPTLMEWDNDASHQNSRSPPI
jgi:hypothetical protein